MKSSGLWVVLAVVAASGCNRAAEEETSQTAPQVSAQEALTDLLAPLQSASTAEVELGQAAAARAVRADVRSFAQTVASDHRAVHDSISAYARANNVTSITETAKAQDLDNAVRTAHAGLETLEGADYDLAYIRAEVESHRLMLARLDQELIPAAVDARTRGLLTDVRAMVDAHLTRSRQLLANVLEAPPPPPPMRPAAPPPPPTPPDTGAVRS